MITLLTQAIGAGMVIGCIFLLMVGFIFGTMWLILDAFIGDFDSWKAIGRFFVKIGHGFKIAAVWIFEKLVYLLGTKQRNKKERQYRINTLSNRFMNFNKL